MRRHDNAATQQGCEQADNQQFGFHVELRQRVYRIRAALKGPPMKLAAYRG
jgi:hypothetical protein